MGKKVAFVIHNMVLFYTIKNLINELSIAGYRVDLYVSDNMSAPGWKEMAVSTYNHLKNIPLAANILKHAYEVDPNLVYDLAFYPAPFYNPEVSSRYKIRYQYGIAKPAFNFSAETLYFDCCLCYGAYDYQFLRHYCNSEIIGNLKYAHLTDEEIDENSTKQGLDLEHLIILYLPTYGEDSLFNDTIQELSRLPSSWQIMVKLHHGTEFLEEQRRMLVEGSIMNIELYGQSEDLEQLLYKSNVVISEGSSACFDAIYFCKPLIISERADVQYFYGEEPVTSQLSTTYRINSFRVGNIKLEDLIVKTILNVDYVKHIKQIREYFFPIRGRNTLLKTLEIIDQFATKIPDNDYMTTKQAIIDALKDRIVKKQEALLKLHELESLKKVTDSQVEIIKQLEIDLENTRNELNCIKASLLGRLVRLSQRVRGIISQGVRFKR